LERILTKHKNIYSFKRLKSFPLVCAFSDRRFNLGFDNISSKQLKSNRHKFLKALGIDYNDLVCMRQVHQNRVIRLTTKDKGKGSVSFEDALPNCDGIITNQKGFPLSVLSADCLPIFLYDLKNSIIGILHAGWRGTYKNIVKKALHLMKRNFKTEAKNLIVALGPAIRSCCYEVGDEFRQYFPNRLSKRDGRFYLDLVDVNKKLLIQLGVRNKNILDSNICTSCQNKNFFSYRKEGSLAGRMMSLIMLKRI